MSRLLLFITTIICAMHAHAKLGYFVAPNTVVADHQEFWAGLELDNCKPRTIVTPTDDYFCDVLWEHLPEGVASDATETLLGAPAIIEGNHEIRGRIVKFRVSEPTTPIEEQEIVHHLSAIKFDPDIELRGLPLDPLKDNEVWLESGNEASTKCIFYGGLEVPTPPDKIEEGKVYCRINWENIPPGFAQLREANTNLLSGKLLNGDTKQILDTHFIFSVEVVVPYKRHITSKRYSIDASVDVLDSPEMGWEPDNNDTFFLSENSSSLDLQTPIQVANEHLEPMILRMVTPGGAVISEQYIQPESVAPINVKQLPLESLEPLEKSVITEAFLELAYANKNAKTARKTVKVIRISRPPTVRIANVTREKQSLAIDYELLSADSEGVHQVYLTELSDIDLAVGPTGKTSTTPAIWSGEGLGTVVLKNGAKGTIKVDITKLQHSRYTVKAVQLGMDGDKVIKVSQSLSQPLVVSRRAAADLPGAITTQVAPVGSWAVIPDPAGALWKLDDKTLTSARQPIELSRVGQYDITGDSQPILPISVYKNPEVRLIIPETVRLNSSQAARVVVNGEEARLTEYELNWYEDETYWGESSAFPLDYGDIGVKHIKVAVSSRSNPDSFYLKSTIKEATVHVQQEESEE